MKKYLCIVMTMFLLLGQNTVALAAESTAYDPYQALLVEINEEYGLQLGYVPVDSGKVSLEEYERTARSIAASQKELEEYIANREEYFGEGNPFLLRSSSKTVTKDCWGERGNSLTMTATYDVNGTTISNPRNIFVNSKVFGIWFSSYANPITSILDSGRTLAVSYTGDHHVLDMTFTEVTVYCEFYYDS